MSRTKHVTAEEYRLGRMPHRQHGATRLTPHHGDYYFPYHHHPANNGGGAHGWGRAGGYAKDRAEHALMKKIGKRRARRRLNNAVRGLW